MLSHTQDEAMAEKYNLSINGRNCATESYAEVINPANGELVGLAAQGDAAHMESAIAAANQAFQEWRHSDNETRKDVCRTIAQVLKENATELAKLLTLEQGKPLKGMGSEFELGGAIGWTEYTAEQELPVKIIEENEEKRVELHRVPVGVVGSITPWNWPLMIAIWHFIPALRTGNTVVIKPSPFTPLSTSRMVELINEKIPPGLLNVVSGGDALGAQLSEHPNVKKIVFTGSTATGKKIMASAADTLKTLTLELGGNDACILLPAEDIEPYVDALFWGAMLNSGQTCGAIKRLYVHEDDYEKTCNVLAEYSASVPMGDGLDTNNMLGPLQNEKQLDFVTELVEDAKAKGARILTGGTKTQPGLFYPVTLVADIEDGTRLVDEEQFGPVLPIIPYNDVDDAIRRANGTPFGLNASVWGSDSDLAADVAMRLEAGSVFINKTHEIAPNIPFGGIKSSGLGVEFGDEGLEAYTNIKIVNRRV